MSGPRDEPSVHFEADPNIPLMLAKTGNEYGVVLVANWPPEKSLTVPYRTFASHVKSCFQPEDLQSPPATATANANDTDTDTDTDTANDTDTTCPAVYIYPPEHLHITIATFTPFTSSSPKNQTSFSSACTKIMERAFARDDWPDPDTLRDKMKMTVKLAGAQIGSRAGILLWDNDDGTIGQIRKIISEEYEKEKLRTCTSTTMEMEGEGEQAQAQALEGRELIIPGIIHSTFLRFGKVPITNGKSVQKKFHEICNNNHNNGGVKELFGTIHVHSLKLVIEKIPYMHIPCDEDHVLASYSFS